MTRRNCKTCHRKIGLKQHRLICVTCTKPYHKTCHPKVTTLAVGYKIANVKPEWICPKCEENPINLDSPTPFDVHFGDQLDVGSHAVTEDERITPPAFIKGQKFGQLNINSLSGKIDELRTFLIQSKFLFCGINETKLTEGIDTSEFQVEGYRFLRFDRLTRSGGGSGIYIQDNLRFLPIHYDVEFPAEVEINIVQLFPQFTKPIIVILVYSPPHINKLDFIDCFESLLNLVIRDKVDYVALGDMNIDLLTDSLANSRITNLASSLNLTQLIKDPTRVTLTTQTLLDHIFVSFPDKVKQSGVFSLTTSDHRFTFFVLNCKKVKIPSKIIQFRSWKAYNPEELSDKLEKWDWSLLTGINNVDSQLVYLESTVLSFLDEVCPLKKKRVKGSSVDWMDCDLLQLIRKRDKLKQAFDLNPSPELKREYNQFRNYVKNRVSERKRQYFKSQFDKVDSQSIWRTFDKLTGKNVKQSNDIPYLKKDDKLISNVDEIAETLCSTFILDDDTPVDTKTEFNNTLVSEAMWDSENIVVSQEEIYRCIPKLKSKHSGVDEIPIKMLKPLLPSLIVPIVILFSTMFKTCDYPRKFKQAIVLPLYKSKGSLTDPNNYRPISSLHSLSKLFEYVLKDKIMTKIENLKILDENQHGFRRKRSCTTALTCFTQNVYNELDKPNTFVMVVFIDLKKGFDSLNHTFLLTMLRDIYNIRGKMLLLLANYLKDRQYLIKIGQFMSQPFTVNRGIGQGFVLGPNLFILFINDIAKILIDCYYTFFADDASIYVSGTDPLAVHRKISGLMDNLDPWLTQKGLSLNYDKTKYMIIRKPQCKIDFDALPPLCINGYVIERVATFKYLGIFIDEFFNFKKHSDYVKQRICVNVGMINRHKRKLTAHMMTILINAYVCSITDYCLTSWGPARIPDFKFIQSKVNKLLAVYCYPKLNKFYSKAFWKGKSDCNNSNSARMECRKLHDKINYSDLLEKFNLLSLEKRLVYFALWNLYKIKKCACDVKQINDMFVLTQTAVSTRNSQQKHHVISHNTELFKSSVQYFSIMKWNDLPLSTISLIFDPKAKVNIKSTFNEHVMKKRQEI